MVAGVFIVFAATSGLSFYNMAVILNALTTQRSFDTGLVSWATTYFFLVSGFAGLGVARLIDRFDPRLIIGAGAVLVSIGLSVIGRAESAPPLILGFTVFGIGFAASGLMPGTTLIARWFDKRRSMALAVASTGLSIGGIFLTPLAAMMIGSRGLPQALPELALINVLIILPAALLFLRPDPERMGLRPDGAGQDAGELSRPGSGMACREVFRHRFYMGLTAAFTLTMLSQIGGMAHQYKLIASRVDDEAAALGVAIMAGASMLGRFGGGWLVGRISMRGFTLFLLVVQAFGLAMLGFGADAVSLFLASIVFGLTVGNMMMMPPLILARAFGTRDYARIYARTQFLAMFGVAAGPGLVGWVHQYGGYSPAMLVIAAITLLAAGVLLLAGPVPEPEQKP